MAAEQTNERQGLVDYGLWVYRHTLKRLRPVHLSMHWLMTHGFIPWLQRARNFHTLPDDPFWFRLELLTDRHEPETVAQFKRIVRPGLTVLDIGAHVGYYARIAAALVGTGGRVIAFEPHPRNFRVLEQNTAHLGNVTRLQVALAEEEGTAQLHDYLMMSASGSLHYDERIRDVQLAQTTAEDFAPRMGQDFQPQVYSVRTAPVDDLLAELGIAQVDVVKMDIEGAELGALRGMRQTIQNSPHIALIMEYNPLGLQAFGHEPAAALREVLAMGFTRVQVIEADGSLTNFTDDDNAIEARTAQLVQHMGVVNLLFTRG